MSSPSISFSCPACQKKFSTPSSLAGKSVKCSCGSQVAIPSPNAATGSPSKPSSGGSYGAVGATPSYPSSGQGVASQTQSYASSGSLSGGRSASTPRRDFPALKFVANVTEFISWLYLIGGILGAIAIVAAGSQGPPEALGLAVVYAVVVAVATLLVVVFIRASAELVRLGVYVAALLEDIRDNTV